MVIRSSLQRAPTERVNRYLGNAISSDAVYQKQLDQVNCVTLRFKRGHKEKRVSKLMDE